MSTPFRLTRETLDASPWFNAREYPFASHYADLGAGKMHYLDEGKGEPVVFVHGTPSWSFEYRDVVAGLRDRYRCITMDHLGFGLSERPAGWGYTVAGHAANLEEFVGRLGLERFTLVVHDFGGPIAIPFALKHPGRIKKLVVMNSWFWP